MEYEFSQDMLGAPVARFSMGHEAFGFWLEDELTTAEASITELQSQLTRIQQGRGWEFELQGREYSLVLSADEARVQANVLALAADELDETAMSLSEEGQIAACGLEDFEAMLLDWQQFLSSIR